MATDVKTVADMEEGELADHLASLHEEQRAILADITEASTEVERREQVRLQADSVRALPETIRALMESAAGLPAHVKHALVEARAADAGVQSQDAVVRS
jgi:hypothetical protein